MIQTVQDVIEGKDVILEWAGSAKDARRKEFFNGCRLDGVVVIPNKAALRFLEYNYVYGTHLVPGRLPGAAMNIGDIFTHDTGEYVTVHFGVMMAGTEALHLIRPKEEVYLQWLDQHASVEAQVHQLLNDMRAIHDEFVDDLLLHEPHEWRNTYVGQHYLGVPRLDFVKALASVPEVAERVSVDLPTELRERARDMAIRLAPYAELREVMQDIRKQARHKGFPVVSNDMFTTLAPAASGGASLHTNGAGDDIIAALPSNSDLFILCAETGALGANVGRSGGGSLKGEHYIFLLPKSPFFNEVQGHIDADDALIELWEDMSTREGDPEESVVAWTSSTRAYKQEVLKKIGWDLVSTRVLGFHVDLIAGTDLLLRPVIAEAALEPSARAIETAGWRVMHRNWKSTLIETRTGYAATPSVFDEDFMEWYA